MTAKGEHNRQSIIDAANSLIYKQGYNVTSLADIARQSGIPKGNFYFYFKSKDELLRAVFNDRIQHLVALTASWETEYATPLECLHRYADVPHKDWTEIVEYGCPIGTLSGELGKMCNPDDGLAAKIFAVLIGWSGRQFRKMGFPAEDADRYARHLLMRMQGAASMAHAFHDPKWIKEEIRAIHQWLDDLGPTRTPKPSGK